jgi:hypothetical protein
VGIIGGDARFVPRPWLLDRVAGWLDRSQQKVFLLTGAPGTGKSVASAWLGNDAHPPSDEPRLDRLRGSWSAVFFCGQRYVGASPDPWSFIQSLSRQLRRSLPGFQAALEESYRPLVHATVEVQTMTGGAVSGVSANELILSGMTVAEAFSKALDGPLQTVLAQAQERVAVLVDGLDEAEGVGADSIVGLVEAMARLPGPLRLFVTAQNDREVTDGLFALGPGLVEHVDLSSAEVADHVEADFERQIRAIDGTAERPLGDIRRIRRAAGGSFLYLRSLLDDPENAEQAIPPDPTRSWQRHVKRLLRRHYGEDWRHAWETSAHERFALLAVLRAPVPLELVATWLGESATSLRVWCDRFQSLLAERGATLALIHRAFNEFLLAPMIGDDEPNPFYVDARAAHRRLIEHYLTPGVELDAYGALYVPEHLAALLAESTRNLDDLARMPRVVDLVVAPAYAERLQAVVGDPVAAGRPYRALNMLLLDLGRLDLLERLLVAAANGAQPATRVAAVDGLVRYAGAAPEPARALLVKLAVAAEPRGRLVALRAIGRLGRRDQTTILRRVIADGDSDTRMAAAYAIYTGWNTNPQRLTSDVLTDIADGVSFRHPFESRAVLEFLANATITTYVNHCSDAGVAQLTSDLWRRVLVDRLRVNVFNRPLLERTLISPILAHHFSSRVTGAALGFDRRPASPLLPLRPDLAEAIAEVIPLLDPAADPAPAVKGLARLLESDLVIFRILAAEVIAVHAIAGWSAMQPVVRQLFEDGSPRGKTTVLLAFSITLQSAPRQWLGELERMTVELASDPELGSAARADPLLSVLELTFAPLALATSKVGIASAWHATVLADASSSDALRHACAMGLGVAGLYFPDPALATFEPAVTADAGFLARHAIEALGLIASLHPTSVDGWLQRWDAVDVSDAVHAASELGTAHRYVETLGLYTNGVHQALNYPFMRRELLMAVFRLLLEASSEREWVRRYAGAVLAALREADYTLLNWTRA